MKISVKAPESGDHYTSSYQLHTDDNEPFGDRVSLDFKLGADQEESIMLESLMDSMNPDKVVNELDFNRPRDGKEERQSMMINQKVGAFPNE